MKKILIMTTIFLFFTTLAYSEVRVLKVKGKVSYKTSGYWKTLRNGMVLKRGTKVSTSFRSWAILKINNRSYVRVKPLSLIKVYTNSYRTIKSKRYRYRASTHIGLRRGGIRAKISRNKRIKTIFKVSTPIATSSVRGTYEEVTYGPEKGMVIKVLEGSILGKSLNGLSRILKKGLVFRVRSGDSAPVPIIAYIKNKSIIVIHDPNISSDESNSHNYHGEDVVNSTDGAANTIDSEIKKSEKSKLNVIVNWPQK